MFKRKHDKILKYKQRNNEYDQKFREKCNKKSVHLIELNLIVLIHNGFYTNFIAISRKY